MSATLDRLWSLFDKAEAQARPPYKRHATRRLEAVHRTHVAIRELMREMVLAEMQSRELYEKGGTK